MYVVIFRDIYGEFLVEGFGNGVGVLMCKCVYGVCVIVEFFGYGWLWKELE